MSRWSDLMIYSFIDEVEGIILSSRNWSLIVISNGLIFMFTPTSMLPEGEDIQFYFDLKAEFCSWKPLLVPEKLGS